MEVSFHDYEPTPKQQAFHASPAKWRLVLGAWGAGKTTLLCVEDMLLAMEYPGSLGVVYRKTYPALRDTTKRDYLRHLPPELLAKEIKSEGREEVEFPNGSRTLFRCLDDFRKLGSTQFDRVVIDEAWEIEEEIFRTLAYGRLRGTVGPRRLMMATNPPNIDHWLYKFFVEEAEQDVDRQVFHFSTFDNAEHLPDDYIPRLQQMPKAWQRKFLEGTWGFLGKGKPVFECFREDWHVAHLIPIKGRTIARGWDFGFSHPACIWLQVTPTGHTHVLHELLGSDIGLRAFAEQVMAETDRLFRGHKIEDFCDVAGSQRSDRGPTAVQILRQEFGLAPQYRLIGVWKAVELITRLLSTAPDGTHLLRIHKTCRMLREALAGGYEMDARTDMPKKDGYYDNCVSAGTLIRTLRGWKPIRDLVGQSFITYAYDGRRLVPARASDVRCTRKQAEVWKLTLDDGELVATPDHPIMRRDGTYALLRDLQPGDSLMPFYEAAQKRSGYRTIHLNDGSIAYEHRYIHAWFNGHLKKGHHVHHRDADPMNNEPENLEQLHRDEHMRPVYEALRTSVPRGASASSNPWTAESRRKVSVWARAAWAKRNTPALCAECGVGFLRPDHTTRMRYCSRQCAVRAQSAAREQRREAANHTVVAVAFHGYEDVYNLEVETHHNFPANGVIVHNCVDALKYALIPSVQPARHLFEGKPLPRIWRVV